MGELGEEEEELWEEFRVSSVPSICPSAGMCTCVCVLVALLLACYSPCGNSSGGESNVPVWSRCYQAGSSGSDTAANPGPISKDDVRQRLAYVSSFYLPARPTRGMLRQVFNHFMRAKGGVENP